MKASVLCSGRAQHPAVAVGRYEPCVGVGAVESRVNSQDLVRGAEPWPGGGFTEVPEEDQVRPVASCCRPVTARLFLFLFPLLDRCSQIKPLPPNQPVHHTVHTSSSSSSSTSSACSTSTSISSCTSCSSSSDDTAHKSKPSHSACISSSDLDCSTRAFPLFHCFCIVTLLQQVRSPRANR